MIKLIQGDCMDVMAEYPDNYFDVCVTSPPYDDLRDYGLGFESNSFDWKSILQELYRIINFGGVVVWIVADATRGGSETGTSFSQALYAKEIGFNLHDTMIWCKDSFSTPENNRCHNCFEYMFVFSKGTPNVFNPIKDRLNKYAGTKIHGTSRQKNGDTVEANGQKQGKLISEFGGRYNYWMQPSEKNSKLYGHPAMFPVKLVYDHLHHWADSGCKMIEPFLGSGSSAIAAYYFGVGEFIGVELDEDYFKAASERFDRETKQETLF